MRRGLSLAALAVMLVAPTLSGRAQLWLTHGEAAEFQGEPAVRFQVYHQHGVAWCVGYLHLTATRVAYDVLGPGSYRQDSFVRPRGEVQIQFLGQIVIKGPFGLGSKRGGLFQTETGQSLRVQLVRGRRFDFFLARNIGADGTANFEGVSLWPVQDAWENFDQALERARTRWDPNRPQPVAPAPPPPEPPKTTTLQLEAQPGGAEFYVDDEFRGTTSGEGKLKLSGLAPGEHRLRLTKKDFQEWNRTLTLEAGENRTIEVTLAEAKAAEPPPPPPPPPEEKALALEDVLKLLAAGVTPVRAEAIVKDRGVSFTLTEEAEKKLRDAGATTELLLAIAKAKK